MLVRRSQFVRRAVSRVGLGLALGAGTMALVALPGAAPAGAATCVAAGTTGLTTALVATPGTITQTLDATGCDVGIYVNVNGVTITGSTISGANDEAILAENLTSLSITNNTIQANVVKPHATIPDEHTVALDGVKNAIVSGNTIKNNNGGGIGVADNGPVDAGTPNPGPTTPVTSSGNAIFGNTLSGNTGGCGIIIEAFNPGGGVTTTNVHDNTITGTAGHFGPNGPDIGQIVVADNAANTSITGTIINNNSVTQSFLSGITLHANAPKDTIDTTSITNNTLDGNNWGDANGAPSTDAIALIDEQFLGANAATISGTSITGNTIKNQMVAIWNKGATTTTIGTNTITLPPGGTAVFNVPAAGGGYWLGGSDGGAFAFGNGAYYGSAPGAGLKLAKPIVAIAPSRDRGGYWELGADGGVIGFGDAYYYKSLPGIGVHVSNIVGMAPTPATNQGATGGLGYWIVGSDGGVFSLGDASFFGSLPGIGVHVNNIVGIVATSTGLGYWLVASDGGVFAFGDAAFKGSMGGKHLDAPVVGLAPTPTGLGYWLVGSDGGIFSFGDATYEGSVPGVGAHIRNVVGIASTPSGLGYTLAGSDGGIFTFGDAVFNKSLPGLGVHVSNVIGLAST